MYYLAGDNSLDDAHQWLLDVLKKFEGNPNLSIAVMYDGKAPGDSRYYAISDNISFVSKGELNTGDPNTLVGFVDWARTNLPSTYTILSIDNHGNLTGIAKDETSQDQLTLKDLSTAFEQTIANHGKLDVLFMNACLMATIEGAYQVRDFVDYYVASEQTLFGPFVPTYLSSITSDLTPDSLARNIASSYSQYWQNHVPPYPHTISVARLSRLPNLITKLNTLSSLLKSRMSGIGNTIVKAQILSQVQRFDSNGILGIDPLDELIDLYDFARLVKAYVSDQDLKDAAQAVMDAIQDDSNPTNRYILYESHKSGKRPGTPFHWQLDQSHGVSIFSPDIYRSFYTGENLDFAAGTSWPGTSGAATAAYENIIEWGPMLVEYVRVTNPDAPDDPNPPPLLPPISVVQQVYFPLILKNYPPTSTLPDKFLFAIGAQAPVGQFNEPEGVAVAPDGTVYVADTWNDRIQRFSATGQFLGTWGSFGSGDGQFGWPSGVAVAPDGTVYVADSENNRIQRFTATGQFLGKWGSKGSGDGQFNEPQGVAVAPDATIYVADSYNHRIQRFSATGAFLNKWGSEGSGDGQFEIPYGVAVAPDGTVYVADRQNDRIQHFTATGQFLGKWGSEGSGDGQFDYPYGVAVSSDGTVYVADTYNHRIQRFSSTGQFLGKWGSRGSGDGQFYWPSGVAVASDGTVYVADNWNNRIQRFLSSGQFLGRWGSYGSGNGQFAWPWGVAVASDGTVYVADDWNHRIQRFSATGQFLGKWGSYGSGDGQFYRPRGVAVAPDGTVYVADSMNYRIQRFSATGQFLGKWGSQGGGDGQFSGLGGVAVASDGTVYVADSGNNRIQRFSTTGQFLGKWGSEGSGDGQFKHPSGVAVAPDGTVYVDSGNDRIQRFSATGQFLGKWGSYGSGDGQFDAPSDVAVASDGTVYVADMANQRIQAFGTTYSTTWRGEYFANRWLTEAPMLIRQDTAIDFTWGLDSPGSGIPSDNFSARWQRYVWFEANTYRFTVSVDDGVRLWVDDQLLIDQWQHPQVATFEADVTLSQGYHRVRLEYYDGSGAAAVRLSWDTLATRTPTPTGTPTRTPTPSGITNLHMSDSCDGPDMILFPAGTETVFLVFDYSDMQGDPHRIAVTDGVTLHDDTHSYTGSGTECILVAYFLGPIPADIYRTEIYAGGLFPIKTIVWLVVAGPPANITVSADPTSIPVGGFTSTIQANVTDAYGNPVADGTVVTFTTSLGTISPYTAYTVYGVAIATLTSGSTPGTATVTARSGSVVDTTSVTFT
jgi:sugar lactone lactonase YvrE